MVQYLRGTGDKLIVVFSGVGTNPHIHPPIEFFSSATENGVNHCLFISDKTRSWLNAPGIDDEIVAIIQTVADEAGLADIHLLGNSMGGFVALMLKDQLAAKTVLSFTPQYSVKRSIIPEEKRWLRFRRAIEFFKYPEVSLTSNSEQRVFIVHGGSADELMHAQRFPKVRGIHHFILPQCDHNLMQHLKKRGKLKSLVTAAIHDEPFRFRRILSNTGGMYIQKFEASSASDLDHQPGQSA